MKRKLFSIAAATLALFVMCGDPLETPGTGGVTGFTVTFDKNHSDADGWTDADPVTKSVVPPATAAGALPAPPTRTNYVFGSWNTQVDGKGNEFTAATVVTADTTVYAKWNRIYTVTFDKNNENPNGTEANPATKKVMSATAIGQLPDNPRQPGYGFAGWYYTTDGTGYDFTETTVVTEDTTVYAKWEEGLSTVIFDKNHNDASGWKDALPSSLPVNSTTHKIAALPGQPERQGWGFVGWNTKADGSGDEFTAATAVMADTTVYAQWDQNALTVTFDKNHGDLGGTEATPRTITVRPPATTVSALPAPPTRANYDFAGWNTQANGSGANFTAATPVTASVTVYAQWTRNFTVTFDKNHSDLSGTEANPPSKTVSPPATTIGTLPAPPTRSTHDFASWNTQANGAGSNFTAATTVTADITVYAQWTLRQQPPVEVVPTAIVNFENKAVGDTYESARGGSAPTVRVAADPVNSGQKSLQVSSTGYNQAAIVPINLPYELSNYKSFTFRFNPTSGSLTDPQILVYAAKSAATFAQYGFGNAANSEYAQFAANLLGSVTADYSKMNQWTEYTITISNPGGAISNLKGDIYLAIGINSNANLTYLFDDLTFTVRDGFVPPPGPPPGPSPSGFPAAVPSGEYRNLFKELGKTDAQITAKVNAAWNQLFVNGTTDQKIFMEVGSDMAYIHTFDTDDVRSEGMSYGMMMCVQMNDKARFDKLWKWAHTYMYNPRNVKTDDVRGYFSWQCRTDGTKKDRGVAPDGEFYFITALLFASARWGDGTGIYEYGRIARHVLYDMINRDPGGLDNWGAHTMFDLTHHLPVFSTSGNSSSHTDPSYNLPAFYDIWAIEVEEGDEYWDIFGGEAGAKTNAAFWKQAATASRAFFPKTVNATTGLGPDYALFTGAPTGGEHQDFRYDAWRIAMNIGMDYAWWQKDPWQVEFADRIQSFFYSKGVNTYGSLWNLNGNGPLQNGADHSPGLVACNAVASLAATQNITWEFIEDFWNTNTTTGKYRYYDGCLYMMGLLHVTGNFKAYFPANRVNSSSISPATAVFDKNTANANNNAITVTMTLNGNTLSSIKNGSATLAQGSNYTVSGNTVTLSKTYLASLANGRVTLTFVFSAGRDRTIDITVGDTTGGGPIGGTRTSYDFSVDTVTAEYNGAGLSATVSNGVLVVTKTTSYSTPIFILPFDLGKPLSAYSSIEMEVKLISGDITGSKELRVEARPENTAFTASGNNPLFGTLSGNNIMGSSGGDWRTITITNGGGANSLSGSIKIGFSVNNTNSFVYQVRKITLKE